MAEKSPDLPDECWESIFGRLDRNCYFEPLSLVSKQFLSITNRLRSSLVVSDSTASVLDRLLRRFPHLKKIDFREFHGDLDRALCEIARSGLSLQELDLSNQRKLPLVGLSEMALKMKCLRTLKCSRLGFLCDEALISTANSLPLLEQIDISNPEDDNDFLPEMGCSISGSVNVTDAGIEELSRKLKNLCKINISGCYLLSDRSLVALSLNCAFLSEIVVRGCCFVTQNGIGFVIRQSSNLVSLSVNGFEISPSISSPVSSSPFTIANSVIYARSLQSIEFSHMVISDSFLSSIAEARFPLKKVALCHCRDFTFFGIVTLLREFESLVDLNLEGATFLTNEFMIELSKFIRNLTSINLRACSKLTNSTFFILIKSCPSLVEIEMGNTSLGKEDFCVELRKNHTIESLRMAYNNHLNDKFLEQVGRICPKLRLLDVSNCWQITDEGVGEILRSCRDIRHLEVSGCAKIRNLETDLDCSQLNLEILRLSGSRINDDGMVMIGKICPKLLHLDLEYCMGVTEKGVKNLLSCCKNLREINLRKCCNMSVNSLAWMVFSSSSLRKIVPPSGFIPTKSEKRLFLHHGCLVLNG